MTPNKSIYTDRRKFMKKAITAFLTTALILLALTACENGAPESPSDVGGVSTSSTNSDSGSSTAQSDDSSSTQNGDSSSTQVDSSPAEDMYPVKATSNGADCVFVDERGVYGETEIPDIHCDKVDLQGSVRPIEVTPIGLESMVFETRTFGDYTVKLVGSYVRTDKENFPDTIYARSLWIEIENEKAPISENSRKTYCAPTILGQSVFKPEYRLFPDRIGSYLDIYDMEYPIIAMRYFLDDKPEYIAEDITRAVKFVMIIPKRNETADILAACAPGLGIVYNEELSNGLQTVTNKEAVSGWPSAVCAADEFKVIDEKTLVDETAGIKYSFDFSDIPSLGNFSNERLTVEKNI